MVRAGREAELRRPGSKLPSPFPSERRLRLFGLRAVPSYRQRLGYGDRPACAVIKAGPGLG